MEETSLYLGMELTVVLSQNGSSLQGYLNTNKCATFKVNESLSSVSFLPPCYIIGIASRKPLLFLWNVRQDSSVYKYLIPGIATTVKATPCGAFLFVACDNKIYLYHLPTGQLIGSFSSHYQPITCLDVTNDGKMLISGGKDNIINVWLISKLLYKRGTVPLLYTFTNHSMAVTAVWSGIGGYKARVFTSSIDNTCNIYELYNGQLLLSLHFPAPLSNILINKMESSVYGVSPSTDIFKLSLIDPPGNCITKDLRVFIKCTDKISAVSLSEDDSVLLVGTACGDVSKYDAVTGHILTNTVCKNQNMILDILVITMEKYYRNDKPELYPYQKVLQRSHDAVIEECVINIHKNLSMELMFQDEDHFSKLVKEAVTEEENTDELKQKVSRLTSVVQEVVKFSAEHILNS